MDTQIVPSSTNGAHARPMLAALPATPSPIKGATFDDVHERVAARASRMLPDTTVHVSDLVFTDDGHLVVPNVGPIALAAHARRMLASLVGVRWDRWFHSASAGERTEELNRRLKRTPGERKLRAWRDETGETAGTLRAILPAGYEPIDDARIFEVLRTNMGSLMDAYVWNRVEPGEETSQYMAIAHEPHTLRADALVPGWLMRSSEIGLAPLSIDDAVFRLVCLNGLLVSVGGKRSLYRTHRTIDDDRLAAAFVLAMGRLPGRFERVLAALGAAMDASVEHPDTIVGELLAGLPRALVEDTRRAALAEAPLSRFDLLNVITRVAHTTNTDPEVRFAMETAAGTLLAA
jgi:hypothetical protein